MDVCVTKLLVTFKLTLCHLSLRTRIVQADLVSDSDSESQNKNVEIIPVYRLTQTVCTDLPAPATTIRTHTVKQRTFFALTLAIRVGT
jgi:hypothetical protein